MLFDAHCDTLDKMADGESSFHFNADDVKGDYVQVFAAWSGKKNFEERTKRLIDEFDRLVTDNKYKKCLNYKDILEAFNEKKIAALLSIEGGEALGDDLRLLDYYCSRGVRMFGLTWNNENNLASGAFGPKDIGLKYFGRKVIKKCEELGIIVDLSHLNEKGFYEAIDLATKPLVLSHSNSYEQTKFERNIKDEQFKALIKNKGVCGINFCPLFLNLNGGTIDDILLHIEHFLSLGGENNVGLGTDFDGIDSLPKGIEGTKSLYILQDRMEKMYPHRIVKKIMGENFINMVENICIL